MGRWSLDMVMQSTENIVLTLSVMIVEGIILNNQQTDNWNIIQIAIITLVFRAIPLVLFHLSSPKPLTAHILRNFLIFKELFQIIVFFCSFGLLIGLTWKNTNCGTT